MSDKEPEVFMGKSCERHAIPLMEGEACKYCREEQRKTYWHVSYFVEAYYDPFPKDQGGWGHTVFSTNNDVMPLVEAMNFIKETLKVKRVVIMNWKEIRKEQFDAFCEEGKKVDDEE